jgi:hypothetical protein
MTLRTTTGPAMTLRTRLRCAAAALLAAAGLTACTTGGAGTSVPTRAEADVTAEVNRYAQQVAEVIGGTRLDNPTTSPAQCTGKGGQFSADVFYVQGAYQLPLPVEQHRAALTTVRDRWKSDGLNITQDRTFANGGGEVSARNPADGYTLTLTSGKPPTILALIVHSGCYRRPGH